MNARSGAENQAVDTLQAQFAAHGVAVLGPAALAPATHAALLAEARRQRVQACWTLVARQQPGEIAQDNVRAYLGPEARAYLASPAVLALLHTVTGQRLVPAWSASCYTYYDGPGQHMGEHCDKPDACRIALLSYLDVIWAHAGGPSAGLQLHVFAGNHAGTPLLARISARANRLVILNGAEQAHLRPALLEGEHLTMLAGCYAAEA